MAKRKTTKKDKGIFSLLKADHEKVHKLLVAADKAKAPKRREELFLQIHQELKAHSEAEEQAVYVPMRERKQTKDAAYEGHEEHSVVDFLFEKLSAGNPESEEFRAGLVVLKEVVEHHVEEEEGEFFKAIKKAFSKEEIDEMGANFLQLKTELKQKVS